MENVGRLMGQIAAEAGITENRAKIALYLTQCAENGVTLQRAADLMRCKPASIKRYACEFMIDFPDYRPFDKQRTKGMPCLPRTVMNLGA